MSNLMLKAMEIEPKGGVQRDGVRHRRDFLVGGSKEGKRTEFTHHVRILEYRPHIHTG